MTAFSDYLEDALLKHTFMGRASQDLDPITNVFVSLHFQDPVELGSFELVLATDGGYIRVEVDSSSTDQWTITTTTDGKQVDNDSDITFPVATSNWRTATHFGIFDSVLGGANNFLYGGILTQAKTVQNGDTAKFAEGVLKVELR